MPLPATTDWARLTTAKYPHLTEAIRGHAPNRGAISTISTTGSHPINCTSYGSGSLTIASATPNAPHFITCPHLHASGQLVEHSQLQPFVTTAINHTGN